MNERETAIKDDTPADNRDSIDPAAVKKFLTTLIARYRTLRDTPSSPLDGDAARGRIAELELGWAALRYALANTFPPQVAVLGPTQTGKSTVVNLLLDASVADISPLAGFTIHPQGFRASSAANDETWSADLFPGWTRVEQDQLSREQSELDHFTLRTVERESPPAGLPDCVVWDTPDFDSLAAETYQRGVLEAAALADVHVFVLSKEKYSDLSVWRMLRLLQPLERPLVICLNKLTPESKDALTESLKQRLTDLGGRAARAPVIVVEHQPGLDGQSDIEALPEVWALRDAVATRIKAIHGADRSPGVRAFLERHWADWAAPVEAELAAIEAWNKCVAGALREARESYRRDFLEHPQRFDTFRRATVELLHLLELPGFANVLSQVRHALSWPARRLFAARQAWQARRRQQAGLPRGAGSEEIVLSEMIEKLLTTLERDAARRADPTQPGGAVWRAVARRLDQRQSGLRSAFQQAAREQRNDFAPVITETANRLYETLLKRPAILNTLRAARTTTDLAAIALAIKTGGLGINDLLFAPAMLGLTSMLTEGALGTYMTSIAADLKKRQLEHMTTRLIEGVFAPRLAELATELSDDGLFGVSREQLQAASANLAAWGGDRDD